MVLLDASGGGGARRAHAGSMAVGGGSGGSAFLPALPCIPHVTRFNN